MPEMFTAAFAQRLNGICEIEVREGRAVIGVARRRADCSGAGTCDQAQRRAVLHRGAEQAARRTSTGLLSTLFRSVAQAAGRNAQGVIMTGMGDDGARGLKEMREAGALTLAQDETSCVVFSMPKGGIETWRGAA